MLVRWQEASIGASSPRSPRFMLQPLAHGGTPTPQAQDFELDLYKAATMLTQLPAAFAHCNETHPHSALKQLAYQHYTRQTIAADRVGHYMHRLSAW